VAKEAAEAAAKQQEVAYQARLLQMQTEETELAKTRQLQQLRTRAEPARKAILEGVMPHLAEAMLAVVQRRPDDPVAYLAMLLEHKAAAVAEGHKLVRLYVSRRRARLLAASWRAHLGREIDEARHSEWSHRFLYEEERLLVSCCFLECVLGWRTVFQQRTRFSERPRTEMRISSLGLSVWRPPIQRPGGPKGGKKCSHCASPLRRGYSQAPSYHTHVRSPQRALC